MIDEIIKARGHHHFWEKFVDRIEGRSSPRLTLPEQKMLIGHGDMVEWARGKEGRGISRAPGWVWERLTGTNGEGFDFSGRMKLNSATDFFEFARLPTGGKLAQAIPEVLFATFVPRLKENMMVNSFSYNRLLDFMTKFCDPKLYQKFMKQGTVYRIGKMAGKRRWFGASTSMDGILAFMSNQQFADKYYPITVNYGESSYFDLISYTNHIREFIDLSPLGDPEQEVLIYPMVLPHEIIIKDPEEFYQLRYPATNLGTNLSKR